MGGNYSFYSIGTSMISEMDVALDGLRLCNDFRFSLIILETDSFVLLRGFVSRSCSHWYL